MGAACRKGGLASLGNSVEAAESNAGSYLNEICFCGRELNRITGQGPAPSLTMEENLFRGNYFIGGKMTWEHLKYLDL